KLIFLSLMCLGMAGCGRAAMTQSEALEMFEKAGGVETVNSEARTIFDRLGTNYSGVLFGPELTNYPALSALGRPLFIQTESGGYSSHIEIPFGSHYDRKFIFIFNPNIPIEFPYASESIQVTTNIFVGK
ncbi:MAG: hypothetical protein ACREE6_16515, partial [Limisphaerales bacterium]